jgi:hypothetical protein
MKSILFLLAVLISTICFSQKNYKLLPTQTQKSCLILDKQIGYNQVNLNLSPIKSDKNNNLKIASSVGIIAFGGIMTINYCTSTNEKFKEDRLGYWGLMGALTAGLIVVQIVL